MKRTFEKNNTPTENWGGRLASCLLSTLFALTLFQFTFLWSEKTEAKKAEGPLFCWYDTISLCLPVLAFCAIINVLKGEKYASQSY